GFLVSLCTEMINQQNSWLRANSRQKGELCFTKSAEKIKASRTGKRRKIVRRENKTQSVERKKPLFL
ncbi:hypothetical protein ACNO7T_18115, partial [Vibrio campbellii]